MPECYVQPVTDRQVCFKCHKTVTGKRKLSKCSKCHAITYCGRECQVADWPRHAWNCIPVMVTEIPGKGRGLVAARDIKMGEFIFLDKPAIVLPNHSPIDIDKSLTKEEFDAFMKQVSNLSSEAKLQFYKLEEGRIKEKGGGGMINKEIRIFLKNAVGKNSMLLLLNVALINHSCAPNAFVEEVEDQKNEVRAIKDISKGEEVTVFYRYFNSGYTYKSLGWKVNERTRAIKNKLGFECKCCVCSGIVPGQEDITKELIESLEALNQACSYLVKLTTIDKIVELSMRLYVGHIDDKIWPLMMLAKLGYGIRDGEILGKAKRHLKKLAEGTQLKCVMDRYVEINQFNLS